MSLFGQINRIKKIKTNILNAIVSKGVSVPEDTKLEDTPTLIEEISGGGSEEWYFENIACLCYKEGYAGSDNSNNVEIFDYLLKHIKQPTSLYKFMSTSSHTTAFITHDIFSKILSIDLSKVKTMSHAFEYNGPADSSGRMYYYQINLPSCTTLYYTFYRWAKDGKKNNSYISLDFQGTTNKVTDFSYTFNSSSLSTPYYSIIKEILNINMDAAKTVPSTFIGLTNLERLTFQGSFGGKSSNSSLTLDLSSLSLSKNAIVIMFNSLSENTNGKTRTFKLGFGVYESLSEEEIAIATNKGYNVSY